MKLKIWHYWPPLLSSWKTKTPSLVMHLHMTCPKLEMFCSSVLQSFLKLQQCYGYRSRHKNRKLDGDQSSATPRRFSWHPFVCAVCRSKPWVSWMEISRLRVGAFLTSDEHAFSAVTWRHLVLHVRKTEREEVFSFVSCCRFKTLQFHWEMFNSIVSRRGVQWALWFVTSSWSAIVENAHQSHTWQWASGHVRSRSKECMWRVLGGWRKLKKKNFSHSLLFSLAS